jgi:plasmid stabilization system protein ParE
MAYEIVWSEETQEEIHEILDYLLDTWGATVAEKFSNKILEVSEILELHPFAGQRNHKASAVRQFPLKPYYMVEYTVIKKCNIVYILNVIDARKKR